MNQHDFSDFRQDDTSNWIWYSDHLSQADVNKLPLGSRFYALYAPVHNLREWMVTGYEVRMMPKVTKAGMERAYVVKERMSLDYAPFDWQPIVEPYVTKAQNILTSIEELEQRVA